MVPKPTLQSWLLRKRYILSKWQLRHTCNDTEMSNASQTKYHFVSTTKNLSEVMDQIYSVSFFSLSVEQYQWILYWYVERNVHVFTSQQLVLVQLLPNSFFLSFFFIFLNSKVIAPRNPEVALWQLASILTHDNIQSGAAVVSTRTKSTVF